MVNGVSVGGGGWGVEYKAFGLVNSLLKTRGPIYYNLHLKPVRIGALSDTELFLISRNRWSPASASAQEPRKILLAPIPYR